jgi:hypothetical protein
MPARRRHARLLRFAPALVLIALALPSSAFGLPNRGWVSGTGDDANSCSSTAPCKTFAGALTKTAAGGVITCLDPGGYGTVVIRKSIAIKCSDTEAGIGAAGTNAVTVNAGVTDKVTLKGLDLNGTGVGPRTGLVGVRVLSAASVHITDSEIYRFKTGVQANLSGGNRDVSGRVVVANSHIHDNDIGIYNSPGFYMGFDGFTSLTARNNLIADNDCGIVTSSTLPSTTPPDTSSAMCGVPFEAGGFNRTTVTSIFGNGIYDNEQGVFVEHPDALALVAYNRIASNSVFGMRRLDSATLQTFTPATNVIVNNAATDPPNSVVAQTKRQAKRNRGR